MKRTVLPAILILLVGFSSLVMAYSGNEVASAFKEGRLFGSPFPFNEGNDQLDEFIAADSNGDGVVTGQEICVAHGMQCAYTQRVTYNFNSNQGNIAELAGPTIGCYGGDNYDLYYPGEELENMGFEAKCLNDEELASDFRAGSILYIGSMDDAADSNGDGIVTGAEACQSVGQSCAYTQRIARNVEVDGGRSFEAGGPTIGCYGGDIYEESQSDRLVMCMKNDDLTGIFRDGRTVSTPFPFNDDSEEVEEYIEADKNGDGVTTGEELCNYHDMTCAFQQRIVWNFDFGDGFMESAGPAIGCYGGDNFEWYYQGEELENRGNVAMCLPIESDPDCEENPRCYCIMKEMEYSQCTLLDCSIEQTPCPNGCDNSIGKCKIEDSELERITLKGKLVDQLTGEPVAGAKLVSAYEFSPQKVITDANGNFRFEVGTDFIVKEGPEVGKSDVGGQWDFNAGCYKYATLSMMRNQEIWEDGRLIDFYPLSITKHEFDTEENSREVVGTIVDLGELKIYPSATLITKTDIESSLDVFYKYKNLEGYNGPGQGGYSMSHSLSKAVPLGYDTHLVFTDESGREYETSEYSAPTQSTCGIVTLSFKNGKSEWSFDAIAEPSESTGPIEIPTFEIENEQDIISDLCSGCILENNKCYPFGYRKSWEYCSGLGTFVEQFNSMEFCENNFECESNICIDGGCVSSGVWKKFLSWFKRVFGD